MKIISIGMLVSLLLCSITLPLKSDCEECKKYREELHKTWQDLTKLSSELRAQAKDIVNYTGEIGKYHRGF